MTTEFISVSASSILAEDFMRIRIIKKAVVTSVTVSNDNGVMNVQEKQTTLIPDGKYMQGSLEPSSSGSTMSVDIHLNTGSVLLNVPKECVEEHAMSPQPTARSRNCCKSRK